MNQKKFGPLSVDQIQKVLPHRHPFLLVDRILEIHSSTDSNESPPSAELGARVIAIKNITFNEPCFQGHFPGFAIFPGVLIIEAMAQTSCFSLYPSMIHDLERITRHFQCVLVGVDSTRFRRPVVPGDTLQIEAELTKKRGKLFGFQCRGLVNGQVVSEAEILANLMVSTNHEEIAKS